MEGAWGDPSTLGKGSAVSEFAETQDATWHDITIAGKQFHIASRQGDAHIRAVERLLNTTFEDVSERVQGQGMLNLSLLTALNLADRLIASGTEQRGEDQAWAQRFEQLVERLETAVNGHRNAMTEVDTTE